MQHMTSASAREPDGGLVDKTYDFLASKTWLEAAKTLISRHNIKPSTLICGEKRDDKTRAASMLDISTFQTVDIQPI